MELLRLKYLGYQKKNGILGYVAKLPIIYLSVGKLIGNISCESKYPNSIDNIKGWIMICKEQFGDAWQSLKICIPLTSSFPFLGKVF